MDAKEQMEYKNPGKLQQNGDEQVIKAQHASQTPAKQSALGEQGNAYMQVRLPS